MITILLHKLLWTVNTQLIKYTCQLKTWQDYDQDHLEIIPHSQDQYDNLRLHYLHNQDTFNYNID